MANQATMTTTNATAIPRTTHHRRRATTSATRAATGTSRASPARIQVGPAGGRSKEMASAIQPTPALHATASRMHPSQTRGRRRLVPSVTASVRCREPSKPDVHARADHDPGVDILHSAARADRLLDDGIEYLEVETRAEPLG